MKWSKWVGLFLGLGIFGLSLGVGLNLFPRRGENSLVRAVHEAFGAKALAQAALPFTSPGPGRASNRHTVIVDIAHNVSPAVVSIGVTKTTYMRQYNNPFDGDLFFPPYNLGPRTQDFPYLGSGFIMDKRGHVLTNYHVVEDASSITVTLTDKRTFNAKLLDADRFVDIALLHIEGLSAAENLPVIPLGNSDGILIGETVLAVGNPFGPLIADPRPSVSMGVISAVKRSFRVDEKERVYSDMIQTDAAINPGNSGGPLINLDGQAIGINTFIFSRSGDSSSVGFSIPINRAHRIADEIIRYGKIRTLGLDFKVLSVTPYIAQRLGLSVKSGAIVRDVAQDGPAQRAGLRERDVIVRADEKEITDETDLLAYFLTRTVGERVKLRVLRNGAPIELIYQINEGRSA